MTNLTSVPIFRIPFVLALVVTILTATQYPPFPLFLSLRALSVTTQGPCVFYIAVTSAAPLTPLLVNRPPAFEIAARTPGEPRSPQPLPLSLSPSFSYRSTPHLPLTLLRCLPLSHPLTCGFSNTARNHCLHRSFGEQGRCSVCRALPWPRQTPSAPCRPTASCRPALPLWLATDRCPIYLYRPLYRPLSKPLSRPLSCRLALPSWLATDRCLIYLTI